MAGVLHRGERPWSEVLQVRYEAGFGGVVMATQRPEADEVADENNQPEESRLDHAPHSGKVTE